MADISVKNRTALLILQHPQEPDKELGTAKLATSILKNSRLKTGLSWANLEKAWGEKTNKDQWIVLYLGSVKLDKFTDLPKPAILFTDRKNNIYSKKQNEENLKKFKHRTDKGIILIDGTWSQAKTIWWRNAWLTKIQRCVLLAPAPSMYGKLRKEPKKESMSTIETIAYTLSILEKDSSICETLLEQFKDLLKKFKR
jgi:DTW domain-containing protein YfiP